MKRKKIFYGWIVVIASGIALLSNGAAFYGFGVFFKPLQNEFGWSHSLTSLVQTLFYIAYGISQFLSGKLSDRYGPRPVFAGGSILLALGFILSGRVHSVGQIIPLYIVAGFGTGTIWSTSMATVQRWFVAKRGLAVAIASSGVGLGILIFSPLLGYLISAHGWRTTYTVFGIATAGILASTIWFMAANPEEKGLRPYGVTADSPASNATVSPDVATVRTAGQAMKSLNFYLLAIGYMFSVLPISLVAVHFIPYAIESGVTPGVAAAAMGFIGGMSVPGRIVGGVAADKLGWKKSMVLFCVIGSGTLIWLIYSRDIWMFYLFTIFFGFSHGTRVPILPGLVSHLFGTRSAGELTGIITGVGVGLGGLGALLAGFVVDVTGTYTIAFLVASVSFVIAAILNTTLRPSDR